MRTFWIVLSVAVSSYGAGLAAQSPAEVEVVADPLAILAAKAAQLPFEGGVQVVVQNLDGSGASEAIVVFVGLDPEQSRRESEEQERRRAAAFPSDIPRRFALSCIDGTRFRVDEKGVTSTPRGGLVLAFAGDRFAWGFAEKDDAAQRVPLRLEPPHSFTVEVVSAEGAPLAGVPVALQDTPEQGIARIAATGADGTLAVRLMPNTKADAYIALDVVTREIIHTRMPERGGRCRLVLPKTTRMRAAFSGDVAPGSVLVFEMNCQGVRHRVVGDGAAGNAASWPFVEIGVTVDATVRVDRLEIGKGMSSVSSAPAPIQIVRSVDTPTVAVQILQPDGKVAIERQVSVAWRALTRPGAPKIFGDVLHTNREGWIEVAMLPQLSEAQQVEMVVTLLHGFLGREEIAQGKVTVQAESPKRIELSALRCELLPVLVAGTVVTEDGKPAAGVEVRVFEHGMHWTYSGGDGRFELRSDRIDGSVEVHVPKEWLLVPSGARTASLPAGSTDARLVVRPVLRR